MDKAKAAVSDFMSKAGHHDTTVHEKVAPAVQNETIQEQRHESLTTAVDKEVHQDHYHTSVQPINHQEVLPEQHHHKIIPVEHRKFEHGSDADVQQRLQAEQAQFRNESHRVKGETTHSANPVVAGEHVHHHVHETIQPVVQKQTIEPHVHHTTVPIHEVHHNAAQHHSVSALPAVSMSDFKQQGGSLTGREERYDGFKGEPRNMAGSGSSTGAGNGLVGTHHHEGTHHHDAGSRGTDGAHSGLTGNNANHSGLTGNSASRDYDESTRGTGTGTTGTTGTKKASLLDKLNPKKDTDGDGKAGLMD